MRVIEQEKYADLKITKLVSGNICIEQYDFDDDSCEINIDKQGAKQLIDVLKEFVND